jgi:chloramphenicol-sensitive protein RarD
VLDEGHFVPGWKQAGTLCPLRSDASTAMVCSVRHDHRGLFYGVTAYALWGIFPLYFRLLEPAGAAEVVAYRVAGALVGLVLVVAVIGRWAQFRAVVRDSTSRSLLACAAVLINWGTYVWGVYNDRVVEAALGYFISPLVTILLGVLILGERLLRRWQWVAIAMAVSAVVVLTIDHGRPPWVAVIIALTFGGYGLARKVAGVDAVEGLTYETMVLTPVAFGYLIWLGLVGHSQLLGRGAGHVLLLTSLGLVTAIPLLSFGAAEHDDARPVAVPHADDPVRARRHCARGEDAGHALGRIRSGVDGAPRLHDGLAPAPWRGQNDTADSAGGE